MTNAQEPFDGYPLGPLNVLHLEDSTRDAWIVRNTLEVAGLSCTILLVDDKEGFEAALGHEAFDLILSDYTLPGYDGITAMRHAREVQPGVPVILVSGTVGEEEAVKCLHLGATDYLLKGRLGRLVPAVRRAMREAATYRTQKATERALVQRERTLSDNQRRMSFALGAARMGAWEIELATDRLMWSETMAPVFGLAPTATPTTGIGFFELIHPDDRAATTLCVGRGIADRQDCVTEFRTVWPDGAVHWVHVRAHASYDAQDRPLSLLGVAMDIDDRKGLENQLHQAQKLEAIGRLAGGVAHDFNNVLTVILGFSDLLAINPSLDDAARSDLLEITKAGAQAAGLTRQLLAFSRKQILQPHVLDLNAVIGGLESMIRTLIVEDIDLRVELAPPAMLVKMDPTQLRQILINLAVNGADAMPSGGRLTIATTSVMLDEHYQEQQLPVEPGDYVMMTVTDTGAGMDDATRARIFEPFFTTKEVGKGTGLGLATVYGIVKQSGGDIRLHSEPGRGTTFSIFLPRVSADLSAPVQPLDQADTPAGGSETILIVEDDEAVRHLSQISLERVGYRVLQASNPKEAVRLASEFVGPIHLLLSDVVMPDSQGPPLYGRLAVARPEIRVLYMSGYADERVRHLLLVDGAPFLHKPMTPQALAHKVRQVLDAPAK